MRRAPAGEQLPRGWERQRPSTQVPVCSWLLHSQDAVQEAPFGSTVPCPTVPSHWSPRPHACVQQAKTSRSSMLEILIDSSSGSWPTIPCARACQQQVGSSPAGPSS